MTDLEICKRIAEIENIPVHYEDNQFYGSNYFRNDTHHDLAPSVYSPLTNDGLCFRLMNKHDISLHQDGDKMFWVAGRGISDNLYDSPNKAICLAIIEANK